MAAPKWTDEQVTVLKEGYVPGDPTSVDALVEKFDGTKTKRMVVGKLVSEGVYVAPEKPAPKAKDEGPTKAELLAEIANSGFEVTGFEGATKDALKRLRTYIVN